MESGAAAHGGDWIHLIGVHMTPKLVVNPSSDAAFVGFAEDLVNDGVTTATELERRLRLDYPQTVVHARLLSGELILVWYVYRDGHWVRPATVADAD